MSGAGMSSLRLNGKFVARSRVVQQFSRYGVQIRIELYPPKNKKKHKNTRK